MGRGLSELQKTILRTALANRRAEGLEPIRYCVEFDNQAERYEHDSPKEEAWRGIYQDLGITERGDHLCVRHDRQDVGIAFDREPSTDPEHFAPLVERLNAKGVKARVAIEGNLKYGDVYLWEVLADVYGFGEHRRELVDGPARTRSFTTEELEELEKAYVPRELTERDKARVAANKGKEERGLAGRAALYSIPLDNIKAIMAERKQRREEEAREAAGKRYPSGPFFSKREIGAKRYEAARVTASKAFERLAERGLAERFWWGKSPGLKLTLKGVDEAERLSATLPNDIKESSQ